MKNLCALLLLMLSIGANADEKAKVALLGVFHFANPQKDLVKSDQVNVMTDQNQQYLQDLTKRLAAFKPTAVLLEYDTELETVIQQRYTDYLNGEFELPANEVYQIGFRVAKLAGLERVHGFDEGQIGWQAAPLFKHLKAHEPTMEKRMQDTIAALTKQTEDAHASMSLRELLIDQNQPEKDKQNKSLYLLTNEVGVNNASFVGADAAASWWHRNFRMYARIQHHAQPGERVLVVGGQGHTAILKDLLADDPDRIAEDIQAYF